MKHFQNTHTNGKCVYGCSTSGKFLEMKAHYQMIHKL